VAPPVRAALGQQQAVGVGLTAGPEDVQQAGWGRLQRFADRSNRVPSARTSSVVRGRANG
jgi:hypothetical protein